MIAKFSFGLALLACLTTSCARIGGPELALRQRTPDVAQYRLIHKRARGCPAGWKLRAGFFHGPHGRRDACENPQPAPYDLDYISSGETLDQPLD